MSARLNHGRQVSSAEPWPTGQLGRTVSSYERHSLVRPTQADDLFMQQGTSVQLYTIEAMFVAETRFGEKATP